MPIIPDEKLLERSKHRLFLCVLLPAVCISAALAFVQAKISDESVLNARGPVTRTPPGRAANAPGSIFAVAQNNPVKQAVQAEVVTINPTGFAPREIARPEGPFILVVENRSGLQEVSLRLNRKTGERVHEVDKSRADLDWHELVDLTPDDYVLTEVNHPNWLCQIRISAR